MSADTSTPGDRTRFINAIMAGTAVSDTLAATVAECRLAVPETVAALLHIQHGSAFAQAVAAARHHRRR